MATPPRQRRGTIRKASSKIVAVWLPDEVVELLDREVTKQDSDRSKEIRKALRKHLHPA